VVAALGFGAALLAGCISFDNVGQNQLPASWAAALKHTAKAPQLFAGLYANAGVEMAERTHREGKSMAKRPEADRSHLALVLAADSRTGVPYEAAAATTVELTFASPDRVELIARRDATIVARRTFESSWNERTGALVLLDTTKTAANGDFGSVAVGRHFVRLFKGSDGCLYVQQKKAMAGTLLGIVPVATGEETWGRYLAVP
jgi:hypothetical protein